MIRRLFLVMLLTITFAGCGSFGLPGASVAILTGSGGLGSQPDCYTDFITAELVTDPTYGSAVIDHDPYGVNPDYRYPVMWQIGDTARQSWSQVEILNPNGQVIARTGTYLQIAGGYYGENPRVWVACGYVLPATSGILANPAFPPISL